MRTPGFWNPFRALRAHLKARREMRERRERRRVELEDERRTAKLLESAVDATLSGLGLPALMRERGQELRAALLNELNRMLGKERHLTQESAEFAGEDIKGLLVKRFGFDEDVASVIVSRLSREIVTSSTR